MTEHIHKTYSCDRCAVSLGSERPKHNQECIVSASFNWTDGPGPAFKWIDLCDPCRKAVFTFFQPNHWERKGGSDAR